jgi:hypothetical protein
VVSEATLIFYFLDFLGRARDPLSRRDLAGRRGPSPAVSGERCGSQNELISHVRNAVDDPILLS